MRQLRFLRSVMRDQKKSSSYKLCVSDLLYCVSVQHLLFFLKCTAEKNLLRCFIQARSLFHSVIKASVVACMNGLCTGVCMDVFNADRWVSCSDFCWWH